MGNDLSFDFSSLVTPSMTSSPLVLPSSLFEAIRRNLYLAAPRECLIRCCILVDDGDVQFMQLAKRPNAACAG